MQINGTRILFDDGSIQPKTEWNIKFTRLANNYYLGRDRGAQGDKYFSTLTKTDTKENIDILQNLLEDNRHSLALSNFEGEYLFGADIDYSGTINCVVDGKPVRKNVYNNTVWQLELKLRAIDPVIDSSIVASISALPETIQRGFTGNKHLEVTKSFSMNNLPSYLDHVNDTFGFTGIFHLDTVQMKQVRKFILTNRSNSIGFPVAFPYIDDPNLYPFGPDEGIGPFRVKIINWSDKRIYLDRWEIQLVFQKDVPYWSSVEGIRDTDNMIILGAGNGERTLAEYQIARRDY